MKKIISLLLLVCLIYSMASCKNTVQADNTNNLASQLSTIQYTYSASMNTTYTFLAVTNQSEKDVRIKADAIFYDIDGNTITSQNAEQVAVEHGTQTLFCFIVDEPYETMSYQYTVQEEEVYKCVASQIKLDNVQAQDYLTVTLTNTGEENILFPEVTALFFNTGILVDARTEKVDTLQSNTQTVIELPCFEEFDESKLFFSGRINKT